MKKRTKFDPNEIIVEGKIAKVKLYKNNLEIAEAIIDLEDIGKINKFKWHLDNSGYCQTRSRKKSIRLHRLITKCPKGMHTDHINHIKLDNRKKNLRVCTNKQNCSNQFPRGGTSKYKGVFWHTKNLKWCAMIHPSGKSKYLGLFTKEIDAAKAYNLAAKKHYGKFALLNEV